MKVRSVSEVVIVVYVCQYCIRVVTYYNGIHKTKTLSDIKAYIATNINALLCTGRVYFGHRSKHAPL